MEIGVDVWLNHSSEGWVAAKIESKAEKGDGVQILSVRIDDTGQIVALRYVDEYKESDDIKLRNDSREVAVDNLINLPYLHEPAILYCLEKRYSQGDIYTYTGPILIAMNPFKKVPLYTDQVLEVYYNYGLLKSQGVDNLPTPNPHVYAIADAAYRDMMRIILNTYGSSSSSSSSAVCADQTILISGESGAGKTESTKIVLRYLTTVGNTEEGPTPAGSVMDKILQSNPILEAFGNARTLRNDNSSRFGKFIELNFNKRGRLIGGTIRTYLLEKVRLPSQQPGERNFHIFYQMAAGSSVEERKKWALPSLRDCSYVNQGGIFELRHVNDVDEFNALKHALDILNFNQTHKVSVLNAMAGILHLGQVQFQPTADGEGCEVLLQLPEVEKSIAMATSLWGVERETLLGAMTTRTMTARGETYTISMRVNQASDARDGLVKALYGRIFEWIVMTINTSIDIGRQDTRADVGVLDIFGFECFKNNSFEQLCINYTNETLQQQFNQFVFKMEQIEYQNERIEWSFIEFPDNQDCLDLIENKVSGILAMLDDECKLPKSTDDKFAKRLYKTLTEHSCFNASVTQQRDFLFCIRHYAGSVMYNTATFVEKNKDEVPKETTTLFQNSTVELVSLVFSDEMEVQKMKFFKGNASFQDKNNKNRNNSNGNDNDNGVSRRHSQGGGAGEGAGSSGSVGTQFKDQLHSLMKKIYATRPHYIRCLKPNDDNAPDDFNRKRTTEQLRYGGVLEAVRVARSGFPVRLSHADFFNRYRLLAGPSSTLSSRLVAGSINVQDTNTQCAALLSGLIHSNEKTTESVSSSISVSSTSSSLKRKALVIQPESIQVGLTKTFLRKQAHDILEGRRFRQLQHAAKLIQSVYRGYLHRAYFIDVKWAVRLLQRLCRGFMGRRLASSLRRQRAAIKIQCCFRAFSAYCQYHECLLSAIIIQSCWRGRRARQRLIVFLYMRDCHRLQRIFRGMFIRYRFLQFRRAVVALQCVCRKKRAKAVLKKLRVAGKDLGLLRSSNTALKQEIAELRAKAAEMTKRSELERQNRLNEQNTALLQSELERLKAELMQAKAMVEIERKFRCAAEEKAALLLEQLQCLTSSSSSNIENAEPPVPLTSPRRKGLGRRSAPVSISKSTSMSASTLYGMQSTDSEDMQQLFLPVPIPVPVVTDSIPIQTQTQTETSSYSIPDKETETSVSNERTEEDMKKEYVPNHQDSSLSSSLSIGITVSVEEETDRELLSDPETVSVLSMSNMDKNKDNVTLLSPKTTPVVPRRRRQPTETQTSPPSSYSASVMSDHISDIFTRVAPVTTITSMSMSMSKTSDGEEAPASVSVPRQSSGVPRRRKTAATTTPSFITDTSSGNSMDTLFPSPMHLPASTVESIGLFERTMENYRAKLKQSPRVLRLEALMRVDGGDSGSRDNSYSHNIRFTLFGSKPEVKSIRISDISELVPGIGAATTLVSELQSYSCDDSKFITMGIHLHLPQDIHSKSRRIVVIMLASRDDRNEVLQSLSLAQDVRLGGNELQPPTLHPPPPPTTSAAAATHSHTHPIISPTPAPSIRPAPKASSQRQISVHNNNNNNSNLIAPQTCVINIDTDVAVTVNDDGDGDGGTTAAADQTPLSLPLSLSLSLQPSSTQIQRSASKASLSHSPKNKKEGNGLGLSNGNDHGKSMSMATTMIRQRSVSTAGPGGTGPGRYNYRNGNVNTNGVGGYDPPLPKDPNNNNNNTEEAKTRENLTKQIQMERNRYERLMLQMLELTNDLNDREDFIIFLKKREVLLMEELEGKEKAHESDNQVRMQLAKRLTQVLMDKEDIKEQLQIAQEQLEDVMRTSPKSPTSRS
eukprot:gene7191-14661_t